MPTSKTKIRELTIADMREMLRARELLGETNIDPLELLIAKDGLLLSDLEVFTGMNPEEIDQLTESQIAHIVEGAKRLNPRFFDQILGMLSRFAEQNSKGSEPSSNAMSSDSSKPDMSELGPIQ